MLKAKPCKHEDCHAPSWKDGFCQRHGNNTPSFKSSGRGLKRQSEKHKAGKEQRIADGQAMIEFFQKVWDSREHYCFETGVYLGEECLTTMCHHCLYKGIDKYERYALEDWNIVLIHPDVHTLTHSNIERTPKIKAYTAKLLKQIEDGEI